MDWNNIFTEEDYLEVARVMQSPSLFMQHGCSIVPRDYQSQYLDFIHMYQYTVSIKARQLGITITTIAYLYWYAINHPYSNIVILSPRAYESTTIISNIRDYIDNGPSFFRYLVNKPLRDVISFTNGSKIMARAATANNLRGISLSILYIDEFSSIGISTQKSILDVAMPGLVTTQGKLIVSTTARPDSETIDSIWKNDIFKKMLLPYTCIDRHPLWAPQQQTIIGEERFRYEYGCEI